MQLTHQDLYVPAQAGILRQISALARKRHEPHGSPTIELWGVAIESCIAEYLVAQSLDLSWRPFVANPGELLADVGNSLQVRQTNHLNGSLIIYTKDPVNHDYVLVVGSMLEQRIVGWIEGKNGKQDKYWRTDVRKASYWVPQSDLHLISKLIK